MSRSALERLRPRPMQERIRAMAAPSPRPRREGKFAESVLKSLSSWGSLMGAFIQELPAGDNRINQAGKTVAITGQVLLHLLDERLIRKQQRPAQRIAQQLAAEVVDEILLAVTANVGA